MFRTTDYRKVVSSRPFLGSAVNNRLRKHLTWAKIDCEETPPPSFRLGFSNNLNMMEDGGTAIWLTITTKCPL